MDNKLIAIIGVFAILIGSIFAMSFTNKNSNPSGSVTKSNENYDDMSSHHRSAPKIVDKGPDAIDFNDAAGKPAPDFALMNQDGEMFKLSDYKGKNVILFFNEGSMCYPACWNQIASLAKDQRFNNDNTTSVSIVIDSKQQWDKIIQSQPKLQGATILFDTDTQVSTNYDVLNLESSMHKGSYPGHTYFIVNKDGIITFVLDDPNMAINNGILVSKLSS